LSGDKLIRDVSALIGEAHLAEIFVMIGFVRGQRLLPRRCV
jgi:hypothetical protein